MFINALVYGALAFVGMYLFGSTDMHEMLFGLGMMLVAVFGYIIADHFLRMAPVFGELETRINGLDSKLDDLGRDVSSIERRLNG